MGSLEDRREVRWRMLNSTYLGNGRDSAVVILLHRDGCFLNFGWGWVSGGSVPQSCTWTIKSGGRFILVRHCVFLIVVGSSGLDRNALSIAAIRGRDRRGNGLDNQYVTTSRLLSFWWSIKVVCYQVIEDTMLRGRLLLELYWSSYYSGAQAASRNIWWWHIYLVYVYNIKCICVVRTYYNVISS